MEASRSVEAYPYERGDHMGVPRSSSAWSASPLDRREGPIVRYRARSVGRR